MEKVNTVGIDISKRVFQLHGSTACGSPVFVKKLGRAGFLEFLRDLPPCLAVMEACGGAHHWGRQIIAMGHECRLIPPVYVKPYVKRQKSDANDAAAIVEAAQRPTMRFVSVKTEEAQADAMLFPHPRPFRAAARADRELAARPAGGVRPGVGPRRGQCGGSESRAGEGRRGDSGACPAVRGDAV